MLPSNEGLGSLRSPERRIHLPSRESTIGSSMNNEVRSALICAKDTTLVTQIKGWHINQVISPLRADWCKRSITIKPYVLHNLGNWSSEGKDEFGWIDFIYITASCSRTYISFVQEFNLSVAPTIQTLLFYLFIFFFLAKNENLLDRLMSQTRIEQIWWQGQLSKKKKNPTKKKKNPVAYTAKNKNFELKKYIIVRGKKKRERNRGVSVARKQD